MNKSYIEWIDYYENATKEDVIQDMMLDINSIKEKDKEIERLNKALKEYDRETYCKLINENRRLKKYMQDNLEVNEHNEYIVYIGTNEDDLSKIIGGDDNE